jgi:ubiquinone/menaquinone biosynthesis C-methylase UbiE
VVGIDISEEMIKIARSKAPAVDFRVDSCSEIASIGDSEIDLVIANYVLMDVSDLEGLLAAFNRVLRGAGLVVAVFSHPCFPQGRATVSAEDGSIRYNWNFPYFERKRCKDPAWGHFTLDFIWFHRSLSDYWKAFRAAGFRVLDFDEPRLTEDRYHLATDEKQLTNFRDRPYSVAFKLQKM